MRRKTLSVVFLISAVLLSNESGAADAKAALYNTNLWRDVFVNEDWSCDKPLKVFVHLKGDFAINYPKSRRDRQEARRKDPRKSALPHVFSLDDFESLSDCRFGRGADQISRVDIVYELANDIILREMLSFDSNGDLVKTLSDNKTWEHAPKEASDYPEGSVERAAYYQAQSNGRNPAMREVLEAALAHTSDADASYALAMIKGWEKGGVTFDLPAARSDLEDAARQGHVGAAYELATRLDSRLGDEMVRGAAYDRAEATKMFAYYDTVVAGGYFRGPDLIAEWKEMGFELTEDGFVDREEPNSAEISNALNDQLLQSCYQGEMALKAGLLGPAGIIAGARVENGTCRVGWTLSYGTSIYYGAVHSPQCTKSASDEFVCSFTTSLRCFSDVPLPDGFAGFEILGGTLTCPPPFGVPVPMKARLGKAAEGFRWLAAD